MVTKRALHPSVAGDPTQHLTLLLTLPTSSITLPPPHTTATHPTPATKYPSKTHCINVSSRLHYISPTVPRSLIYLPSQRTTYPPYSDQPTPFRQLRHFYYLSGCDLPDCHLTYDVQKQKLTLYIPPLDPREVLWTGMPKGKVELMKELDVDDVRFSDELRADLDEWVSACYSAGGVVYCLDKQSLPPPPPEAAGIGLDECALAEQGWGWTAMRGVVIDTTRLLPTIDDCRVFKDSHEISLLRQAISITRRAHISVMDLLRTTHGPNPKCSITTLNESHLEATFTSTCISLHARTQAYEPIMCSGRNCATLHYTSNSAPLAGKQLLLIDAGCEFHNYASDITRTYPLSGTWTPAAKAVYDIVDRMQFHCIARTIAGVSWRETHILAARLATEGLLSLGIFHHGSIDEILKAGTWTAFFPHGLGHMLGLETHDVEGTPDNNGGYDPHFLFNSGNSRWETTPEMDTLVNRIIRPNMVLTVEPGIYFCEWIIKPYLSDPKHMHFIDAEVLEGYWDVGGVRIEDVVLVNEVGRGNEVLSKDIPRGW
ncbi:peptidase M24, structural domain-containing protein [Terfezia claveryi]|nr:peptidase M24, structural domain-containing protein [Terfezia claveryi]